MRGAPPPSRRGLRPRASRWSAPPSCAGTTGSERSDDSVATVIWLGLRLPELSWQALQLQHSTAVVVEARGLERQVVACSAGALQQGLAAGMSEAQARLQQPGVRVEACSPAAEARLEAWVMGELDHFSDCREWLPPGAIAARLRGHLEAAGLDPWIAIAPTRTAALLAAASRPRRPRWRTCCCRHRARRPDRRCEGHPMDCEFRASCNSTDAIAA